MPRMRLGDMLIRAGLIDEPQLNAALAHQRQWGGKLGDILVQQDVLDEMMLWRGLSRQLGVTLVSLPELRILPELLAALPAEMCERLEMVPIARDERSITIATSDPNNIGALDEVAFRTGLKVKVVLAPAREVEWALRAGYHGERNACPPPRQRRRFDHQLELAGATPVAGGLPRAPSRPPLPMPPHSPLPIPPHSPLPIPPHSPPPHFAASSVPPQHVAPQLPTTHTPLPNTPLAELAAARFAAQPFGGSQLGAVASAPSQFGGAPMAPPAGVQPDGASLEEQLLQSNELLRALIELCIQRGVFTRDELWQRLMAR